MKSVSLVRGTAYLSSRLFRHAPRVYAALYAMYKHLSERNNIAIIRRAVKPGARVADIGANVGFYTALLAQCVGPGGCVYAFEPDETNFRRLVDGTTCYAQVHPVRAAVTESDGTVDLYVSEDLNVDHRTYDDDDESRTRISVRGLSLDSFFRGTESSLGFIKMDIQGAEYQALLGMREIVSRSPNLQILMELWPYVHDRFGVGVGTLLDVLESWGFEIRRVVGKRGGLGERVSASTSLPERGDPDFQFDVLCIRPGT